MGNCTKNLKDPIRLSIKQKIVEKASSTISVRSVYKFGKTIGQGTFGVVKKATNLSNSNKTVAIKTIFKKQITSSAKRLKSEIDIMLTLDHPNIIKCFETFEDDDSIHIVIEYLAGGELVDVLPKFGSVDESTALMYARSMLMAVNHIHQIGIVHRDLKPENFLFGISKTPEDLKLVDFGLSNKFSNKFEKLHSTVGTPFYIAPEVLKGNYDSKCDMWSIGVILFIMLSGDIPFYGNTVGEVFKKIESGVYSMVKYSWAAVNEEARHLVTRLLCLNTHDRLSASEALMHPAIFSIPKSISEKIQIISELLNYSKKTFLQKCFDAAVARYLAFDQISAERKAFIGFDRNLKGVISAIEICDTLEESGIEFSQHNISELMNQTGIRHKGKMYFCEFISCLVKISDLEVEILKLGFEFFDRERKGFIDAKSLADSIGILGKKIEVEEAEKMIREVSTFGIVGFGDFKSLV